jgi:hypothetical protein
MKMAKDEIRATASEWSLGSEMSQMSPQSPIISEKPREYASDLGQKSSEKKHNLKWTLQIIDWYWLEHRRIGETTCKDGFCQCESESIIEKASNPYLMRAFLIIGVFTDQLIHRHHNRLHGQFSSIFKYPKNHRCQTAGMANANWFIYSYHGYDKKISWNRVAEVGEIILSDTIYWLELHEEHFDSSEWAIRHLYPEINHVFDAKNAKRISEIISKILRIEICTTTI